MKFGCCAPVGLYDEVVKAGYDFIEIPGGELSSFSDEEFEAVKGKILSGPIPCLAVNAYAKSEPKMVGDGIDSKKTEEYAKLVMKRAAALGVKTVGIGAPGIRRLPEDYDKRLAWEQGKEFLRITCAVAEKYGITVLFESVHKYICDFCTTAGEVYDMVDELKIPNLKMVVDFYHLKPMGTDIYDIGKYMKYTVHLHTSGMGESYSRPQITQADYEELLGIFKAVKALGYDGTFSNESDNSSLAAEGKAALDIIKKAYKEACGEA